MTTAQREPSWLGASSLVQRIASVALFVAVWQVVATAVHNRLLPTAGDVFAALVHEAVDGPLLFHLGVTLARVAAAFVITAFILSLTGI